MGWFCESWGLLGTLSKEDNRAHLFKCKLFNCWVPPLSLKQQLHTNVKAIRTCHLDHFVKVAQLFQWIVNHVFSEGRGNYSANSDRWNVFVYQKRIRINHHGRKIIDWGFFLFKLVAGKDSRNPPTWNAKLVCECKVSR